ncbi:concanavalin A-like lectin/glucanase domain-containing protein [Rhodofomes roseus]|uniref:Concanavalin A-like lectin/glucanase domain-containing protein n=1 Tax=Rhodofomes roseus TaxID=34475 RepID=A0ABQ8KNY2_9APHY|nr:concanavalin A-like lectin/glucanase domain-containing protein [Rhodofomes roseus]KAH9840138.1 concanavalin A-like lectin/glucanase domain-containing protein [Rhodofomes roseus]
MKAAVLTAAALYSSGAVAATSYSLVKEYAGASFFDGWVFYDFYDNTTSGDINYVSQANATAEKLAYVDNNGAAIIKVDNTTFVPWNQKRDSVRVTTADYFDLGSVLIMDATHIPYGCGIWPSFWTKGESWPAGGEIDIVEAINSMTDNQYALHSNEGCSASSSASFSGSIGVTDCNSTAGCQFSETKANSYGPGFSAAGGGVYATLFDTSGVAIWFWSRNDVPSSISATATTVDISDWGTPSANYSSTACNFNEFFAPQQIVLDITMCGTWAGVPSIYGSQCPITGASQANATSCYMQNVYNNGNQTALATAYFEINYIRAFNANGTILSSSGATTSVNPTSAAASGTASVSGSSASSTGSSGKSSGAGAMVMSGAAKAWALATGVGALFAWTLM